jgi:hypothetical protein
MVEHAEWSAQQCHPRVSGTQSSQAVWHVGLKTRHSSESAAEQEGVLSDRVT